MTENELAVERWARSRMPLATMADVERRVLLESPRARRPSVIERIWSSTPGVILRFILTFAGVAGVAAVLSSPDLAFGRRGFDAEVAVPLAGVCFALAALFMVAVLVEWHDSGRPRSPGRVATALLTVVPAAITLPSLYSAQSDVELAVAWSVPVWIAGALALLCLVLVLVAADPEVPTQPGARAPLDVALLSDSERSDLLALREKILRILADRDEIKPGLVERARSVPLGQLHTLKSDEDEKADNA